MARNPRREAQTRVNLKVNDRVNVDVAVNLKVRVEVVIVKFLIHLSQHRTAVTRGRVKLT